MAGVAGTGIRCGLECAGSSAGVLAGVWPTLRLDLINSTVLQWFPPSQRVRVPQRSNFRLRPIALTKSERNGGGREPPLPHALRSFRTA